MIKPRASCPRPFLFLSQFSSPLHGDILPRRMVSDGGARHRGMASYGPKRPGGRTASEVSSRIVFKPIRNSRHSNRSAKSTHETPRTTIKRVTAAGTAGPEFREIHPLGGVPSNRTDNGPLPTLRAHPSVPFRLLDLPQRLPCFREVRKHRLPPLALILEGVRLARVRSVLRGVLPRLARHVWCGGHFQQHRDHLPRLCKQHVYEFRALMCFQGLLLGMGSCALI
jgi:hypothetical protein